VEQRLRRGDQGGERKGLRPVEVDSARARQRRNLEAPLEPRSRAARDIAETRDQQPSHACILCVRSRSNPADTNSTSRGRIGPHRSAAPAPGASLRLPQRRLRELQGSHRRGRVDYGLHQKKALTDDEKAQGKALFCQAKPLTDLVIEARTIGAARDIPIRVLPCRVQKMERLADDVMALY
jgi:hypothetical protein